MWNPIGKGSCSRPHGSFEHFPCFSRKKPNLFQTCPLDLDVLDAAVNGIARAWPHCNPRDVCGKFLLRYCGLPPCSVCILFWNVLYLTGPNRCHYSTTEEVMGSKSSEQTALWPGQKSCFKTVIFPVNIYTVYTAEKKLALPGPCTNTFRQPIAIAKTPIFTFSKGENLLLSF